MFNPTVPQGTFSRAFFKGAGSGAMMMGIFSGVLTVGSWVGLTAMFGLTAPLLPAALGMMGFGALATGLFSGYNATQRAVETAHSAGNVSHQVSRAPIRAPEHGVAQSISQAAHNQSAWVNRVTANRASGQDRINQIITNRNLSDGDRAAAILREREQSSTLEASR